MATVRLDRVRKSYLDKGREQVVVHDIDLAVNDGEFLVLVGPSGCGKSTTLRMIAGLESISAGTIRIGDRVVNDVPARDRDIAMVFQNYALYPHMSVAENLGFALKLRGMPAGEIATRVGRAAELLELTELLNRRPKQLSGGQRQRVAVGRAIVRSPQVFLFDEPLSNLDAKLRVQMRRQIAALRRTLGTTTIYVTHDQIEAMTLGDRIVVMKEGRIQQVDDPIRIYQRPANTFVASFVGSPPMNLIRGTVDEAEGRPVFQSAASAFRLPLLTGERLPEPGRDVILGVRPEGWRPEASGSAMTGVVDEVEPLGSESFVLVKAGGALLTVRLEGSRPVRRGDRVSLSPAASEIHWFDGPTEVRIGV